MPMPSDGAKARLAQLWQWPLLLVSLGVFAYASYRFINPPTRPDHHAAH